ncbi:DUF2982 domain-containing protein [Colwellia sp. E2M01]|uniref:DUF2982 domain-containing protein n=1 Tax=Colwellia sp. E2M01 TaxID=2841561 RepID=UPI001C09F560|nr:DUF2982 domain-containing protein [Colwellia sp. E2M01]MBU2869409.1 DUF2982 domain-containing protein [Colwellia sp. E2M01]
MQTQLPIINIKAQSNHHALFLMLTGIFVAFTTLAFSQGYWLQFKLVLIFIYLSALVVFITGLAKYLQPQYSLCLTPKSLLYHHRYGQWQLEWQQIQRIALMNETFGLTQIQPPYVAIRLVDLTPLAKQISPRLANRLIHEQKPLLALAIKLDYLTLAQCQLNFDPFILSCGQVLKGPLAAFMHHTTLLHSALGYHLFLPETALDRELNAFCSLLTKCKAYSEKYN